MYLALYCSTCHYSLYIFSTGSFWNQSVESNAKETPLVSMRQRPLIVPATLHFSGLQQGRFPASHTREATNGKCVTKMLTLEWMFLVLSSKTVHETTWLFK